MADASPSEAPVAPAGGDTVGAARGGTSQALTSTTGKSGASNKKSPRKKAGKQPGAQGFGRTQKLAVDETAPHYADYCAVCGQALEHEGAHAYTGWDEIDIAAKVDGLIG